MIDMAKCEEIECPDCNKPLYTEPNDEDGEHFGGCQGKYKSEFELPPVYSCWGAGWPEAFLQREERCDTLNA